MSKSSSYIITPQEGKVLAGIGADKSLKEIAAELGVDRKTVEYHWSRLRRKLKFKSQVSAALFFHRIKL